MVRVNVENSLRKQKRNSADKPIDLYVEKLVVADYSVFQSHQIYANTTNTDLVLLHMRIYFSHVIYGVSKTTT